MNKLFGSLIVSAMLAGATMAYAGGPVVIEEEGQPEVVAESPRSGWIVPVIVGVVLLCAIACGGDDEPASGPVVDENAPPDT